VRRTWRDAHSEGRGRTSHPQSRRHQRAIVELKGQDIFASGTWNGISFSDEDLDAIVRSFDFLNLGGHVPLKLGHEGPDARDDPANQFALGWVKRVYREGKKLLADFDVHEKVASWIKEGFLRFVSVELLKDVKADTREIPWVLDAVALLGADQPAVGILKSLSLTMARSAGLQCRARVAFSRANPQGVNANMADEKDQSVSALMARLDKLESEKKTLETKVAEGESFQRKFTELQQQTHGEKVTAHRAALMALFEAPIKDKKILPAVREQFKRVYRTETDDVLNVTAADADVFMRANPNPDAPKTPTTLGSDPNDPAEKALAFARKTLNESRDSSKPKDQVLVEAIQAQFRSNPDLAKAWQNAPGQIGSAV
jgi:hypothetical protein